MYIILSPAKSLSFSQHFDKMPESGNVPIFTQQTKVLHKKLKSLNKGEIGTLMHISENLSELNYRRYREWTGNYTSQKLSSSGEKNFTQSLSAFTGDVYQSFTLEDYKKSDWIYADKHIGILSGFYGILSPLTYMKPYRLEMGTKLQFSNGKKQYKNLYEFWQPLLTEHIQHILKKEKYLINLASLEYAKAINLSEFRDRVITIDFKVQKVSGLKVVGIFAKKARGAAANEIILRKLKNPEELKTLKSTGFTYSKKHSTDNHLVYIKKEAKL